MRGPEVILRMKVRGGQLAGFEKQVSQCVRETREKDTKTFR
jgi:hypothetical protein